MLKSMPHPKNKHILSFLCVFFCLCIPLNVCAVGALVFDPSVFARLGSEAVQLENQ